MKVIPMHTSTRPFDSFPGARPRLYRIAALNDALRRQPHGPGRRVVVTRAVSHMGASFIARALAAVAHFDAFTSGLNVHGERDYGQFRIDDHPLLFKITYLEPRGIYPSADPADPEQTLRVLTIMFLREF